MVTTTFAAVALSAALTAGSIGTPVWQSDYGFAMSAAAEQKKPLAIFIAGGETGYAGLVGGAIPVEAGQMLAKNFVCLYVNTDTTAGKALAGQFDVSKGLVISNTGGKVQALRYTGAVAPAELTKYLSRYGDPAVAVVATETAGATAAPVVSAATVVPAGAVFGGCPNGQCGLAPVYQGYPAFSTCPNGRCTNAR